MTMPRINLLYARAANGVIGHQGAMPWHLPEDLAHFKALTMGCPVIMGRKTWDSLPMRFRPLPGRTNVVITRQPDWKEDGAVPVATLDEALKACGSAEEVWVIGGAQIFAQAEPLADRIEVTEIAQDFPGDVFAPQLGPQWVAVTREDRVSSSGLKFSFISFIRYNKHNQQQGN
jgi:dihydrofolate reductase